MKRTNTLTQRDLCEAFDVPDTTLSSWLGKYEILTISRDPETDLLSFGTIDLVRLHVCSDLRREGAPGHQLRQAIEATDEAFRKAGGILRAYLLVIRSQIGKRFFVPLASDGLVVPQGKLPPGSTAGIFDLTEAWDRYTECLEAGACRSGLSWSREQIGKAALRTRKKLARK